MSFNKVEAKRGNKHTKVTILIDFKQEKMNALKRYESTNYTMKTKVGMYRSLKHLYGQNCDLRFNLSVAVPFTPQFHTSEQHSKSVKKTCL